MSFTGLLIPRNCLLKELQIVFQYLKKIRYKDILEIINQEYVEKIMAFVIYVAAKKYKISLSSYIDPECVVPLIKYNGECSIQNVDMLANLNVFNAKNE